MPVAHDPRELFHRFSENPILRASQFPKMVNAVFNPGATAFNGETLLLLRVEDRSGLSRLVVATSEDGYSAWNIDLSRGLEPLTDHFEEHWGIEDPRITQVGDEFFVVYVGFSTAGPLVCLAKTEDFDDWQRCGVLLSPEDKDAAILPNMIDGRWALIHRRATSIADLGTHIWLSYSPDLRHWGDSQVLMPARRGGWWDANKIGLGPPPILTDEGWLVCYHGVRTTASGSIYRLGLALLDRDDPAKVLARGNEWVFGPSASYERWGDVPDVVFSCGWVLRDDGDTIDLYYGAADSAVCVAVASLKQLLEYLHLHPCVSDSTVSDRLGR